MAALLTRAAVAGLGGPARVLSLGAGVQSSTAALMIAHGEMPPVDAGVFADTGAEPESVYRWLAWLETKLPFPVYRVMEQRGLTVRIEEAIAERKQRTSSPPLFTAGGGIASRQCTLDFKIEPIRRLLREMVGRPALTGWRKVHRDRLNVMVAYRKELAAAKREDRGVILTFPRQEWNVMQAAAPVVQLIGISLDEAHRMKPSRDAWVRSEWPLVEAGMKRRDCLRWMQAHGYPEPPRSACSYCPYRDNEGWRSMRDHEPDAWEEACRMDELMRDGLPGMREAVFVHRSLVPLRDVDLSTDFERGQGDLFGNECTGMCGL